MAAANRAELEALEVSLDAFSHLCFYFDEEQTLTSEYMGILKDMIC